MTERETAATGRDHLLSIVEQALGRPFCDNPECTRKDHLIGWVRDLERLVALQAEEIDDRARELSRREGYTFTLENRIEAAKLALGGHPAADALFDTEVAQ